MMHRLRPQLIIRCIQLRIKNSATAEVVIRNLCAHFCWLPRRPVVVNLVDCLVDSTATFRCHGCKSEAVGATALILTCMPWRTLFSLPVWRTSAAMRVSKTCTCICLFTCICIYTQIFMHACIWIFQIHISCSMLYCIMLYDTGEHTHIPQSCMEPLGLHVRAQVHS